MRLTSRCHAQRGQKTRGRRLQIPQLDLEVSREVLTGCWLRIGSDRACLDKEADVWPWLDTKADASGPRFISGVSTSTIRTPMMKTRLRFSLIYQASRSVLSAMSLNLQFDQGGWRCEAIRGSMRNRHPHSQPMPSV